MSVPGILYSGFGLAVAIAVAGLIVLGIFRYLAANQTVAEPANPMGTEAVFPPRPRIEDHPAVEVQQLREQEDRLLSTYGWADKKAGVVRIPINRAMQLQLERGFPGRKEARK